jgi:peptide/nickel transport system permease protein
VSQLRFVARRAAFAVLAAYLVVSLTFMVVVASPNVNLGGELAQAGMGGASEEEIEELREEYWAERGGEDPVKRYARFMTGIVTLDWGESYELEEPVTDIVWNRLRYTMAYVVPGVVLAFAVGSLLGVLGAFKQGSFVDNTARLAGYLAMGLPAFWLAHFLDAEVKWLLPWLSPSRAAFVASPRISDLWTFSHPLRYSLPALVLSLGLVAGLLQHSRAESIEYERAEFVKLLEAKGSSRLRVARHVLRNAAIPILTLSFVEVLGVLMLNIYIIESVFGIPGLGTISLFAVENQDTPLILGSTMVLVFIGIGGNFLQDVLYGYLDPTINED